ncbi:hypothetical protein HYFRA_00008207 [Hymenoscyphus fraxineus]|uniref:Uncharacterized protein n=1 Tax=Hymenoscyphus fraxineus TaxID=746836 RepID=A0A9N9PYY3_9HELO|nr:hypothetical protein HYFRA_00008207 [Hymenoscyphus fraxineus]
MAEARLEKGLLSERNTVLRCPPTTPLRHEVPFKRQKTPLETAKTSHSQSLLANSQFPRQTSNKADLPIMRIGSSVYQDVLIIPRSWRFLEQMQASNSAEIKYQRDMRKQEHLNINK